MSSNATCTNYAKLAAIAPGKGKPRSKKRQRKQTAWQKEFPRLTVPAGVLRYFLNVPPSRHLAAIAAGCHYDPRSARWYIDNPKNLADFAAWKPSRVGFDKMVKQLLSARADTP